MDTKFLNWFLQAGSVSLPKRFLALMAPLGLSFEELGEIVYLFSLEGRGVPSGDVYARTAAADLVKKRLITYNVDTGEVSFAPLFDRMLGQTTAAEAADAQGNAAREADYDTLTSVIKRYEKEKGILLSARARRDISEIILRYGWSSDLCYHIYDYYHTHQRQHYSFLSFAQMAHNAGVLRSGVLSRASITRSPRCARSCAFWASATCRQSRSAPFTPNGRRSGISAMSLSSWPSMTPPVRTTRA